MRKINVRDTILLISFLIVLCIFKAIFIDSFAYSTYYEFVKNVLIYWEDAIVNIIWLSPILLGIYLVSKKYFFRLQHFDMRYGNRANFINKTIFNLLISAILLNLGIAIFQTLILSVLCNVTITINYSVFVVFAQYVLETVFIDIFIFLCALYIKNFMYTIIAFLIIIVLLLIMFFNLSLFEANFYIPFLNLYYSNRIYLETILIILLLMFLSKKVYMRYDVLGGIDQ